MKKKILPLAVLCGLLVLLIGAYILVMSLSDEPQDTDDETVGATYNVCAVDKNTVNRLSYTLNGVEYAYALNDAATAWIWVEDATLPLDNLYFANMVTAVEALSSTVRLTDVTPADLVSYGLDEGAVRFSVTDASGTRAYRIGTYNSFNGKCYFADEAAPTTVYMVDGTVSQTFLYTPYDMIQLPELPTDITPAKITRLTLTLPTSSSDSPDTYTYNYYVGGKAEDETNVWYGVFRDGEEIRLSDEDGSALSTALSTIAFSSLASYRADEQEALGLDAATATVMTIDYKITESFEDETTGKVTNVDVEKSFSLLLGGVNENGLRYATVEGSPLSCVLVGEVFAKLTDGSLLS